MPASPENNDLISAWVGGGLVAVDKRLVHLKGLKHKAVSVFLNAGGKTLIQQRAAGKYHSALLWANSCCTHPAMTETAVDCAQRRLEQELGIKGLRPEPLTVLEYRAKVSPTMTEHEVVEVLVAEVSADVPVTPNPEEVAAVRWIGFDALKHEVAARPQDFTEWLKIYLREFAGRFPAA